MAAVASEAKAGAGGAGSKPNADLVRFGQRVLAVADDRLREESARLARLSEAGFAAFTAAADQQVREDFAALDTVSVDGFLLARTEAQVLAGLALRSGG